MLIWFVVLVVQAMAFTWVSRARNSGNVLGIKTTEHEKGVTFFARVRKTFKDIEQEDDAKPCECVF